MAKDRFRPQWHGRTATKPLLSTRYSHRMPDLEWKSFMETRAKMATAREDNAKANPKREACIKLKCSGIGRKRPVTLARVKFAEPKEGN